MEHPFALRDSEFGQIVPEHGLDADRELLLGQQRALGHAEHEFRSHLLRGTDQLRCAATEQAILRKVSENRAPIGPLRHPNEGWELRLHQRRRGVSPAASECRRSHFRRNACCVIDDLGTLLHVPCTSKIVHL